MVRDVRRAPTADAPAHRSARPAARLSRRQRLPGILLAVLLAVLGGSSAVTQQTAADLSSHAGRLVHSEGQSAGTHHQDPPQHLYGGIAHPVHAAAHTPQLPLLPAADRDAPEPPRGFPLPERPQLSAAHLTHRSPQHGRAPPTAGV